MAKEQVTFTACMKIDFVKQGLKKTLFVKDAKATINALFADQGFKSVVKCVIDGKDGKAVTFTTCMKIDFVKQGLKKGAFIKDAKEAIKGIFTIQGFKVVVKEVK